MTQPANDLIPTELSAPAPRTVFQDPDRYPSLTAKRVFAGFLTLAFVFCASLRPLTFAYGTKLKAQESEKYTETPRHGGEDYYLRYRYDDGDERKTGSDSVTIKRYNDAVEGEDIHIRLFRIYDWNYTIIDEPGASGPWSSSSLYLAAGVLALGFWYGLWFVPSRQRQIIENGEAVVGQIIKKRKVKTQRFIKYQFCRADGETRKGSQSVRRDDYNAAYVGQEIVVVYDPLGSKSFAYDYCVFKADIPQDN